MISSLLAKLLDVSALRYHYPHFPHQSSLLLTIMSTPTYPFSSNPYTTACQAVDEPHTTSPSPVTLAPPSNANEKHALVERRRRETINEGINELAKIVPGCEKNKGSILQRAVQFITQLKENETQNIEKWTLEKLLTEQAIQELSSSCDKLKSELQKSWDEVEVWRKRAVASGYQDEDSKGEDGDDGVDA
jgi:hypothetical protein